MSPQSVPHLLAIAHGVAEGGPATCFYCGCSCPPKHPTSAFVTSSFTGLSGVAAPGSPWVCPGCVLCLREDAVVDVVDGTRRRVAKGCMRAFSWAITATSARAASKAHLDALRALCLAPPDPPFAVVLSDSGKTHQLYRGVVNHDRGPVVVTLEAERVEYRPHELRHLLSVAGRYCAATGKPAWLCPT